MIMKTVKILGFYKNFIDTYTSGKKRSLNLEETILWSVHMIAITN